MAKLVLYMPDGTLHDILLDKERLTIGRRPDNDVCLPYPAVSGEHAQVMTILADSFLEDLGSTNGTLVNGKPIVKHFLRDNDLIDIGRQRLIYYSEDDAQADPLPPDMLRRELRGLHDQVDRVRGARDVERRKPLAAPGAGGVGTADPLSPDDDLLAEIERGALPGERKAAPAPDASAPAPAASASAPAGQSPPPAAKPPPPSPVQQAAAAPAIESSRRTSTVASRLASTWKYEDAAPAQARSVTPPVDPADDEIAPSPPRTPSLSRAAASAPAYWIRVLSGPNAGREVPVTREECSVGRVGTQVARIAQQDGRWRLSLVEGAAPVVLNGTPVPAEGTAITPGDRFEVAGVELAFERR